MWEVKITLRPVALTASIHSLVVSITALVVGYVEMINASSLGLMFKGFSYLKSDIFKTEEDNILVLIFIFGI
jgi:hypothetical protein